MLPDQKSAQMGVQFERKKILDGAQSCVWRSVRNVTQNINNAHKFFAFIFFFKFRIRHAVGSSKNSFIIHLQKYESSKEYYKYNLFVFLENYLLYLLKNPARKTMFRVGVNQGPDILMNEWTSIEEKPILQKAAKTHLHFFYNIPKWYKYKYIIIWGTNNSQQDVTAAAVKKKDEVRPAKIIFQWFLQKVGIWNGANRTLFANLKSRVKASQQRHLLNVLAAAQGCTHNPVFLISFLTWWN